MTLLANVAQSALDLLFPPRCAGCGASGAVFCANCQGKVVVPAEPLCLRCGRSLAATTTSSSSLPQPASLCASCTHGNGPQALTQLRAVAIHEGPIREAIHALKYKGQRRVAQPLGDLLAQYLQQQSAKVDFILPVPLHRQRQRERGFNQAELLGRRCATHIGVHCLPQALIRQRATAPQVGLSSQQRRLNVADAFLLSHQRADVLAGKHLVLIDDVATTGSTLDAAAAALLPVHPASILGLAVTRPTFA